MSNCTAEKHSFCTTLHPYRYEDYELLLNDSSPRVVNTLPFQEVEVESTFPFQDLGTNFTFCCVAVNSKGSTSDILHSVLSKIPTCSLVERGEFGFWCLSVYMDFPWSFKKGEIDSIGPLSPQNLGGFGACYFYKPCGNCWLGRA